jgi:TPR repeat protein
MRSQIIFLTLLISQFVFSQNFTTVGDVNRSCVPLNMGSNDTADNIDDMLDILGLFKNFVIVECPNINNAIAKNIISEGGLKIRYILYDPMFFEKMNERTATNWAAKSILAHEIGHHLNGHALNNIGSTHQFEIEADEFSGFVLGKMGASLEEALSAINSLSYEKATKTHPAKMDRLASIEKGWQSAKKGENSSVTNENSLTAELNYFKGLEYLQNNDYSKSFDYFLKAAKEGHSDAQRYIGDAYQGGVLVLQDYVESRKWYKKAAEKGNAEAQYALGWIYQNGIGDVTIDEKLAYQMYLKAAENGHLEAQTSLGLIYFDGWAVKKNYPEALKWLQRATEQGQSIRGRAEYHLGMMYEKGKGGIDKDSDEAIYWYKKAAELHNYFAQKKLKKMK